MTTKILSGTYNAGYSLKSTYSAVSVTPTGRIFGASGAVGSASYNYIGGQGGMGGDGLTLSFAASAANDGQIVGGRGGAGGYGYYVGGQGGYGGAGVYLAKGASLTNDSQIAGGAGGVGGAGYYGGQGGVGGAGVYLAGSGHVSNTGTIHGGRGGSGGYGYVAGGYGGYGGAGVAAFGAAIISNQGSIVGGAGGAADAGQGVTAALNISGDGVDLAAGGRVTNGGGANHTAIIRGYDGIHAAAGAAVTVTNFAIIDGTSGVSVDFRSQTDRLIIETGSRLIGTAEGGGGTAELAGGSGTITGLGALASLSGGASGQLARFGDYDIDGGTTWTLIGPSRLGAGHELEVRNGGTAVIEGAMKGAGLISLASAGAKTDLFVGPGGATFSGGGQVQLSNNAGNTIEGLAGGDALVNISDTISGAGEIGAGQMTLLNAKGGSIIGNRTQALVIDTGSNVISNAGLIENLGKGGTLVVSAISNTGTLLAAGAGALIIQGRVSGGGVGQIAGGTLFVQRAFHENVAFTGATGILELGDSVAYDGEVSGFSMTGQTAFDLADISFVNINQASFSGTASGGVLTVSNGARTAHIHLTGDYTSLFWVTQSDGHGGVTVRDTTAPPPATASALSQQMAAMGGAAPAVSAGSGGAQSELMARPLLAAGR
ncbi:MAG TPA: hypothetical protein VG166_00220 [Caulobacteraceae bacterium]|jgi:hypothetical protein|nr:hypothetical protein [Caulobacteraceae bacterium]